MSDNCNASGLFTGFLIGAAVGVAVGMLYAPKSGVETRAMLMDKMDDVKEKVADLADTVKEKAANLRGKAA